MTAFDSLGIVLVTAGTEAEAVHLARHLVDSHLAACVSMVPIQSVYRWQGEVQTEPEWQLIIKTDLSQFEQLTHVINQHHSYEVPEIIALPIVAGLPSYLSWIQTQIQEPEKKS